MPKASIVSASSGVADYVEDEVNGRLREKMEHAFADVLATAVREKCSLRLAAYMVAIQRVLKVHELRGMYA